jgi:hypothetical protein
MPAEYAASLAPLAPLVDPDAHRWPDNAGELAIPVDPPDDPEPEPTSERPPLPKRRPGTNHLAVELRNHAPAAPPTTRVAAGEHNPGAAAAFRSGIRAGSSDKIGEPAVSPSPEPVPSQGESANHDR